MPFGAIPFQAREAKAAIANKFCIQRIPQLLVFGPRPQCGGDRPLINADVRGIFESGDYMKEFPYQPQKYGDLNRTTHDINKSKSIVVFSEFCDDCEQEDLQETLKCASASYQGSEDVKFFWVVQPTEFTQTLRAALKLPSRQEKALMVLLDLHDDGAYYVSPSEDVSIQSVLDFVHHPGIRMQV